MQLSLNQNTTNLHMDRDGTVDTPPPSWPRQSWLRSKQMSTLMSEQYEGDSEEGLEEEEQET